MNQQSTTSISPEGEMLITLDNQIVNLDVLLTNIDLTIIEKEEIIALFILDSNQEIFANINKWKPRIGLEHDNILNNVNLANQIGSYSFMK